MRARLPVMCVLYMGVVDMCVCGGGRYVRVYKMRAYKMLDFRRRNLKP